MIKTGWKKLAIWALVISTLSGVVVGSQVMAIKTSEALEKMKEAGKIQLMTNVFSKCVQGRIDQPYKDTQEMHVQGTTSTIPKTPLADNPFNELRKHIPVGAWLEKQVQGKINNGTIYCEDKDSNIVNVFANTLGIDKAAIYCDGKKPGIFKLQNQNSKGEWVDVDGECAAGLSNGDLKFVFNDEGALAHVKKLYNKKKQDNSYLVAWGDRGTFKDDLINYFLYFNDFTAACSNDQYSGDESLLNKTKYFGPIKVPNPSTGNMDERYYSKGHITSNSWGSNWINSDGAHTCDAVIKRINDTAPAVKKALDKTEKDDDGTKPDDIVGDITEDADKDNAEEASPCATAGQSLGWIICPVVQMVSSAVSGIYGYIENNFLQMNSSFVSRESDTHEAWDKFRDFANIAFTIILLVIILSQITGFGVNNYGIKKILPSMIVVAVLVNLSFFLCEIAVDLSNIVGYGAKEVFDNIISSTNDDYSLGVLANGLAETFISGAAVGLGIVIAASTVEFWIIPLLLLLLTALISVIFFFILLGVRQAGIIILIALSPIAIICYALPNTKKIFERWWKLFSALLLVYPICGVLMGGGRFASRLLLNAGSSVGASNELGFAYAFVAIMLQAVPFFFIPSILKSSLSAMGNLGMKLSNFGRNLGRGATGAIRHSEGYRDMQARLGGHNAQRTLRRMNKTTGVRGLTNRMGAKYRNSNLLGAKTARNSYERKQDRLQQRNTEEQLRNARAGYAADGNYGQRLNSRLDAEHERYINGMADDIELANANIATDDAEMGRRHAAALEALNADPTSDQNRAAVRAYQNMLNASGDGGRRTLFDNYAQNIQNHGGEVQAGTQMAAQHLIREHARDIKPKSRDFFGMLGDVSRGERNGTFQQFADSDGKQHWMSLEYGAKSVGGYDASSFAQADEGSIDRLIAQARNGQLDNNQKTQLEEYTRKALDGQHNIHAQGKVANKMNELRDVMGFSRVSQDSGSTVSGAAGQNDSGSIIVPRNGSSSTGPSSAPDSQNNGTIDLGTIQNIVRNPNGTIQGDIHTDGLGTVRIQNGSTVTDSGIILPPRDTSRRQNNGPRQNNNSNQ